MMKRLSMSSSMWPLLATIALVRSAGGVVEIRRPFQIAKPHIAPTAMISASESLISFDPIPLFAFALALRQLPQLRAVG
jgi:hypothetical protein